MASALCEEFERKYVDSGFGRTFRADGRIKGVSVICFLERLLLKKYRRPL